MSGLVGLNFGDALAVLEGGGAVARQGWNGRRMWLRMQRPGPLSLMTHPYIYIEYPPGHPAYPEGARVPWLASQTDMFGKDWMVVREEDINAWSGPRPATPRS
jgi:hypothetical protein